MWTGGDLRDYSYGTRTFDAQSPFARHCNIAWRIKTPRFAKSLEG